MDLFEQAGISDNPALKVSDSLTVLSFGGGQDSTAILYKMIENKEFREKYALGRLLVVMADTGDEHKETYEHVKYIVDLCKTHQIEFVMITPDMGFHAIGWPDLRSFYRTKKTCGSKAFPKTCTDRLKLGPIYRFLEDWLSKEYGVVCDKKKGIRQFVAGHGKIKMLIGIARGEERRMLKPEKITQAWKRATIDTLYPLIDEGMDRGDCQAYMRSINRPVPLPSNCILCPFMAKIELLWLYRFLPADYADWVAIEDAKIQNNIHVGDRNLGVWGKKLLPEILKETIKEFGHMTDAELWEYKMSHGHCVMSAY